VALIEMDARVDLLEWSLQKILFNHLEAHFFKLTPAKARYYRLGVLKKEIALMLSVMAYAGQQNPGDVEKAFMAAVKSLELDGLELREKDNISLPALDLALDKLAKLKPLLKPRLLKACVASVANDQKVLPVEIELLRAFSDVLDCPMPPVIL